MEKGKRGMLFPGPRFLMPGRSWVGTCILKHQTSCSLFGSHCRGDSFDGGFLFRVGGGARAETYQRFGARAQRGGQPGRVQLEVEFLRSESQIETFTGHSTPKKISGLVALLSFMEMCARIVWKSYRAALDRMVTPTIAVSG